MKENYLEFSLKSIYQKYASYPIQNENKNNIYSCFDKFKDLDKIQYLFLIK